MTSTGRPCDSPTPDAGSAPMDILRHRRAVLENEARLDALLDMYLLDLDIRHERPAAPVP
jgi:hypothetical protein